MADDAAAKRLAPPFKKKGKAMPPMSPGASFSPGGGY